MNMPVRPDMHAWQAPFNRIVSLATAQVVPVSTPQMGGRFAFSRCIAGISGGCQCELYLNLASGEGSNRVRLGLLQALSDLSRSTSQTST